MHLVINEAFMLLYCVGVGLAYPNPWIPFQPIELQEESNEYVGPALFGEVHHAPLTRISRNPLPEPTFNFLGNGIMAGLNFLDNLVPPVYESAVKPIHGQSQPKNFTRSRRHEAVNGTTMTTTQATMTIEDKNTTSDVLFTTNNTTKPSEPSVAIVTPVMPIMEDKMDKVSSQLASKDASDLQLMISQLNKALEHIQSHGNEKVNEEISEKTSTEKLVQYISSNVEQIVKNKSNKEARDQKIKQITFALDILLNRIAKSAKNLLPKQKDGDQADPLLMARIVQHMAQMKQQVLSDKVNNGYELSSAELDGGLPAKFRPVRQDDDDNNIDDDDEDEDEDVEQIPGGTTTITTSTTTTAGPDNAKQEQSSEQQSSSQEGGGNLVANLLSSFLGSLSTPTGGVDVDAIVALVSGLSVQRDDGTFDFSGVTDLLQSFLGGDEEGGGGSDVGSFLGGLLGAVIQGSANPPGPKGTGRLTGNLVAGILPGLLGPPPPSSSEEQGNGNAMPGKPLDSGSFLAGILTSMLGASSGSSSGSTPMQGNGADNHKMGSAGFFMKLKQELFKGIFSLITSILGASSGGISQASGASSGASSGKFGKH